MRPGASAGPGSTSTPLPIPSGVTVPLPSADQLREDARLRWGIRIPATVRRWAFLIVPAARRYGVDPNLVAAVMTMESNGDPTALSSAGARGLMQVLNGPWDPAENVTTGVRMLAGYLGEFRRSVPLALAAYNAGPHAVMSYHAVPPYRETRDYVIIVLYLYDLYSHHHVAEHRQTQYRRTLQDLKRFKDQRRKIPNLARAGQVNLTAESVCRHFSETCDLSVLGKALPRPSDPFWLVGTSPDPLQHVG
ncbi:MAG: lytic transglycosylase domain-containing protein [Chloroflexota bacterium]